MFMNIVFEFLLWIIGGSFFGLVIGQFLPNRESIILCILICQTLSAFILLIIAAIDLYKYYKRERRLAKRGNRGGFIR